MGRLNNTFGDLLGDNADSELARLVADLASLHRPPSAPQGVHRMVQHLAHERAHTDRPLRSPSPHTWLNLGRPVVLALVAAFALVGAAFAGTSLVDKTIRGFFGSSQLVTQHLGEDVNLVERVCGYSMAITRVYADANLVVIGYSLTAPSGRSVSNIVAQPTLVDSRGHLLRALVGAGASAAAPREESGNFMAWDAAAVAGTSPVLTLRMIVPSVSAIEHFAGPIPAAPKCETYGVVPGRNPSEEREVSVRGPLNFKLKVPVDHRLRIARIYKTAKSQHGTTVTLTRIVATPAETRVYLQSTVIGSAAGGPALVPTLIVGGKVYESNLGSAGPTLYYAFNEPVFRSRGSWLVRVLTDPTWTGGARRYTGAVDFQVEAP